MSLADEVVLPERGAETVAIDSGNTAWLLKRTGLVLLMTPELAFFYGGRVRKKNILPVLMPCFMAMCLVTVTWVVAGYALARWRPHGRRTIANSP